MHVYSIMIEQERDWDDLIRRQATGLLQKYCINMTLYCFDILDTKKGIDYSRHLRQAKLKH